MGSRGCRLLNLLKETLWISRRLLFCYLSSVGIFRTVAVGLVHIVVFFVASPSLLLAFSPRCTLFSLQFDLTRLNRFHWILRRRNRLSNVAAACIPTEMSQISNFSDTNCWILRRRNRLSNVACILTETSQISDCSDTNCWL